ncbi:MAG: GNAT family N-acetyltransferase [Planctomycetaceae bacterium]
MDSTLIESDLKLSANTAATPSEITLEICEPSNIGTAEKAWRDIEGKLELVPLACTWTWTKTWIECYQHLVSYRIVVGRSGNTVCGVCLLSESRLPLAGPIRKSTLSLGTAGEPEGDSVCVEYNAVLTLPEHRRRFEDGLFQIVEARSGWDEFRIDGFGPEDLPNGVTSAAGFAIRTDDSLYFDLNQARQANTDALTQLSYKSRKRIRKNLKSYGPLTVQWADTRSQAHEILDDLITLHQARWEAVGKTGVFASQPFLDFHRNLLERLRIGEDVGLFRVLADDKTLGCTHVLIDRNRVLNYQGGTVPLDGKLSPGVIVDYLCIEECLKRNFDAFDFLGHVSHHKRKLSTATSQLLWAVRRRPRLKYAVVDAAQALRNRWRRLLQPNSSEAENVASQTT